MRARAHAPGAIDCAPGGPLLDELLSHADATWLYPGVGALLAGLMALLAGLLRSLRWRVWGSLFLVGMPLATWTGHVLALLEPVQADALLVDAAGVGWAVLAAGISLALVAGGQLVGVERGRVSLARSIVPSFTAGVAGLLLGLQGWLEGVGLLGVAWFAWFAYVAVVAFLGGLRYDTSARHHAGRVLLGFLVVAGTVLLAVGLDHVVIGLGEHAMAEVSPGRRAVMEIDAIYVRSGVRKMSFVAVLLSLMIAGSASQGSMGIASDLKGSATGLLALAGLVIFASFEGWLTLAG